MKCSRGSVRYNNGMVWGEEEEEGEEREREEEEREEGDCWGIWM